MAAKAVQMHGLENVDKTDNAAEETPPAVQVGALEVAPAAAPSSPSTLPVAPPPAAPSLPPAAPPATRTGMETTQASAAPSTRGAAPSEVETRRIARLQSSSDFREHHYRVPRTFRFDVDLLEYIERHERYRAALEDPRTFTEKINEWVRVQMLEEDPVLLQAEADVMGLRNGRNGHREPERAPPLESLPETPLATSQIPSVPPPESPVPSPRKGPSMRELEKQLRSSSRTGASAGTL